MNDHFFDPIKSFTLISSLDHDIEYYFFAIQFFTQANLN